MVAAVVGLTFAPRRAAADPIAADKLPETALADRSGGKEGEYLRALHAGVEVEHVAAFGDGLFPQPAE